MARPLTALCSLLVEAGLSASRAKHLERCLDRGRFSSLGADDLASLMLKLVELRLQKITDLKAPPRLSHSLNDVPGQRYLFPDAQMEGRGRRD